MHHLALGLSPMGLTGAPFAPALDRPLSLRAADLGLAMNPEARVEFLPPIAGFVGSDCLAVIAATHLPSKRRPAMAIGIGTNTEIALVHDGTVTVTSCASGPAFEGYQITSGMKATEGAIERVTFGTDGVPRKIGTIGGKKPVGICGSGVVDVLAGLVAHGVVTPSGALSEEHPLVRRELEASSTSWPGRHRRYRLHAARRARPAVGQGRHRRGMVAPAGQHRARAAGPTPCLRGRSVGNYLDLDNALAVGLLPPVPHKRISFVDAAGVGAQMALIDPRNRVRMAALRRRILFRELRRRTLPRGLHARMPSPRPTRAPEHAKTGQRSVQSFHLQRPLAPLHELGQQRRDHELDGHLHLSARDHDDVGPRHERVVEHAQQ